MEKCPYCLNSRWDGHDRTCPQVIGMAGPGAMGPGYGKPTMGCDFDTWEVREHDVCLCEEHKRERRNAPYASARACPICGESWGHRWNCTLNQK